MGELHPTTAGTTGTDMVVTVVALLVLVLFIVGVLVFSVRGERQRAKQMKEDDMARHQAQKARGEVDDHDRPLCLICGDVASRYVPVIDRPWFDKLPLISWVNRLYALPWRYSVVYDVSSGPRLCATHGNLAVEKMEHFVADVRAKHAEFNHEQQQLVMAMNRGGLEESLKDAERQVQARFGASRLVGVHPIQTQSHVAIALPTAVEPPKEGG